MATKFPAMTKVDHRDFCLNEGWTEVLGATGKKVRHHQTFRLGLWDGSQLRTHISHPVNKVTYGVKLESKILKMDLRVSANDFWQCVKAKVMPNRGEVKREPGAGVPLYLYRELQKLGVTAKEFEGMNEAKAKALLAQLLTSEASEQ